VAFDQDNSQAEVRMKRQTIASWFVVAGMAASSAVWAAPEPAAAPAPVAGFGDAPAATVDRAELRKELAAERKVNLARFHRYRLARVYPHNTYQPNPLNVWTDDAGHLCAVATMVDGDGQHALVTATAHADNFVRLADVHDGPLLDWLLTSGLTQEEAVMIQQPSPEDVAQWEAQAARDKRREARALARADATLAAAYREVEHTLEQQVTADAGLDLAVARLAARPDLVAALHARHTD
jgi:hypothetical protein